MAHKKNKITTILNYLSFILITSVSLWYILQVKKEIAEWQLIVPWALAVIFFMLWRVPMISKKSGEINRPKVKRYR